MAFSVDPQARSSEEFRRIIWEQAYSALQALRKDDILSGIHTARKATRRARAALRLGRPGLKDAQYRALKIGFREVARTLSPIRDADVIYRLASANGHVAPAPSVDDAREKAAACRQRLQRLLALIELEPLPVGRKSLIKGFMRGHRAARRRMVIARAEPSDANLHAWRKSVKVHRHQLQLLAPIWPALLGALATEAEALQADLGRQRDLALLAEAIAPLSKAHRAEARACTAAAFSRGAMLFAAQDRLMAAWLRALWDQRLLEQA